MEIWIVLAFSYFEKKHSMSVIKNVCGICHRLKRPSFNENIITGKGIIEAPNLVGRNLKACTLMSSEIQLAN